MRVALPIFRVDDGIDPREMTELGTAIPARRPRRPDVYAALVVGPFLDSFDAGMCDFMEALQMSSCRSCGATIVFAKTISGKPAPFQRDKDGEWWIDDDGFARRYVDTTPKHSPSYTSHFATCRDAKSWRGKR